MTLLAPFYYFQARCDQNMRRKLTVLAAELRILIGYLGEKSQCDWWGSNFLGPQSKIFLSHPYPRTSFLAQYHGVCEAALLVHDEYIGVGKNYHLYRLPDSLEREIAKAAQELDMSDKLKSTDEAFQALEQLVSGVVDKNEGPVNVGTFSDASLEGILQVAANHYLQAFKGSYKSFPYMREDS